MNPIRIALSAALLGGGLVAPLPALSQDFDPADYTLDLTATVLDLHATVIDMGGDAQVLSADVEQAIARSGDIQLRQSGDEYVLSVASDVLFGFDSADLSPQAQSSLSDVAGLIQRTEEGQVRVLGHTDSKGSDDYNLTLSNRRAEAVADFLRGAGVSVDRLQTEGRGESEPVAENEIDGQDNPDGRAQNRRVEFVLPKEMFQN